MIILRKDGLKSFDVHSLVEKTKKLISKINFNDPVKCDWSHRETFHFLLFSHCHCCVVVLLLRRYDGKAFFCLFKSAIPQRYQLAFILGKIQRLNGDVFSKHKPSSITFVFKTFFLLACFERSCQL